MGRPADERGFGFRAEGLLRILVAADAEQVLIAVEELGFRLPDRAPITSLTELIAEVHGKTETIINDFIADVAEAFENVFTSEPDLGTVAEHRDRFLRGLTQLKARTRQFKLALQEKRDQIDKEAKELAELIEAI